jgi:hypothetical protein
MNDRLTKKQEEQMLNDLFIMQGITIALQQYLKSIGKLEEANEYVKEFMKGLKTKNLVAELKKVKK